MAKVSRFWSSVVLSELIKGLFDLWSNSLTFIIEPVLREAVYSFEFFYALAIKDSSTILCCITPEVVFIMAIVQIACECYVIPAIYDSSKTLWVTIMNMTFIHVNKLGSCLGQWFLSKEVFKPCIIQ